MVFNLFVMVAVLFQSVLGQKRPKIKMSNLTLQVVIPYLGQVEHLNFRSPMWISMCFRKLTSFPNWVLHILHW